MSKAQGQIGHMCHECMHEKVCIYKYEAFKRSESLKKLNVKDPFRVELECEEFRFSPNSRNRLKETKTEEKFINEMLIMDVSKREEK